MRQKCIVLLLGIFAIINLDAQATVNDRAQIEETLWNYINGRNNGVKEKLNAAFHPLSDLRYVKNDTVRLWSSADYIGGVTPGYKHNCLSRIVSIDQDGNAAIAKVEIEYPNTKFADYINLLKLDGQWKIAVKSFSRMPVNPKRALFVLTSHEEMGSTGRKTGIHLGEVSHVYKPIHDAGYEIDFVSPKGGKTYMYGASMNDPKNLWMIQDASAYYKLTHAVTPDEIDPEKYAVIYFVGGHGTMWDLPNNEKLNSLTSSIYEKGGIVSAVCHGPSGLVNIKLSDGSYLVDGKKVTSFTDDEERAAQQEKVVPFLLESKLKERGAEFSGAENFLENVVVDGRLITGQNPASAATLALEIIKMLAEM